MAKRSQAVPAGWHEDPIHDDQMVWWDGLAYTATRRSRLLIATEQMASDMRGLRRDVDFIRQIVGAYALFTVVGAVIAFLVLSGK